MSTQWGEELEEALSLKMCGECPEESCQGCPGVELLGGMKGVIFDPIEEFIDALAE